MNNKQPYQMQENVASKCVITADSEDKDYEFVA
jgi:hypothetical protein